MEIIQAEFTLTAKSKVILPEWKGSTIRGALGENLKKLYCVYTERITCYKCKNIDICPYGYLYETQPKKSSEKFSAYKQVTKPITIEPPLDKKTLFKKGEKIVFKINFFGKGKKYIAEVENSLKELKFIGRFRNRGFGEISYDGKKINIINLEKPQDNFERVKINFITPTQLIFENSLVSDIRFSHIIKNISRKYSAILCFHEETKEKIDWKEIFEEVEKAEIISTNLEKCIIETYSTRLDKIRKNAGIIGTIEFDLKKIKNKKIVNYLLNFGKYAHVGKFATFGFGMYEFTLI
ncbi:MAG: CRISPR system precrRNA processing endoribonuclease RAMP protein Cas6 [Candidatus Diapherotrites archaeon]